MKILIVMTNYPFPPQTGSEIIAYNTIKYLSKRHEINLVCIEPTEKIITNSEFVSKQILVRAKKNNILLKYFFRVRSLFGYLLGKPQLIGASLSLKEMRNEVNKIINSNKFDATLLFEMDAIKYFPEFYYGELIVNIEDPQSIKSSRMSELEFISVCGKFLEKIKSKIWFNYEKIILPKIKKVILLSSVDMEDMLKQGYYKNLAHVPYGADYIRQSEILPYEKRERSIIFSGNMYHPPNIDGILFFLRDVFPLVLKEYPSAILWIVGSRPDPRIYEATKKFDNKVVITGKVPSIGEYINRASVSICPVRLKIGVQTKILEALSWGTPVVTTSAGNSGIMGVSGKHLFVTDDANRMAREIANLLNGDGWSTLSREGRLLSIKNFSWEKNVEEFEKKYITDNNC